jgi:hypothetical protein
MRGERNHACLHNIGTGPALNIRGVIFGSPLNDTRDPQHVHDFTYGASILNGVLGDELGSWGAIKISGEASIDKKKRYTLYAPPALSSDQSLIPNNSIAVGRLTITYHDVFNRKHASIFDFVMKTSPATPEWRSVEGGFFPDIEKDLHDLEEECESVKLRGS